MALTDALLGQPWMSLRSEMRPPDLKATLFICPVVWGTCDTRACDRGKVSPGPLEIQLVPM